MKNDSDTPKESAGAGSSPSSCSEVWRSECCGAPVVIVRSDTSVFDYCDQQPDESESAELESHDVGEGSEFWMDDYVRIHHHACAKCRNFIGEPWMEETLDSERRMREMVSMIARMEISEDAEDSIATINGLIEQARNIMATVTGEYPQNVPDQR